MEASRAHEPHDLHPPGESRVEANRFGRAWASDVLGQICMVLYGALEHLSLVPPISFQAQQQRVVALERLLSETQHALSTSEARRQSAEAEIGDLRSQVQDAARSSALHADALVEKEEEIRNLHVVIESMARGGGAGGEMGVRGPRSSDGASSELDGW